MCADAKVASLVYYEDDFPRVLRKWPPSCIMKHSFVDYTLIAKISLRFDARVLHAIRLLYDSTSVFYFFYL